MKLTNPDWNIVRESRGLGIREGRLGGGGGWLGWMQAVEVVYRDEISKFIKAFLDMTSSGYYSVSPLLKRFPPFLSPPIPLSPLPPENASGLPTPSPQEHPVTMKCIGEGMQIVCVGTHKTRKPTPNTVPKRLLRNSGVRGIIRGGCAYIILAAKSWCHTKQNRTIHPKKTNESAKETPVMNVGYIRNGGTSDSVSQCAAVCSTCCSVLQCVATVCCRALHYVEVYCKVWQGVAALQCFTIYIHIYT